MSLIKNTLLFVGINFLIGTLLIMASSSSQTINYSLDDLDDNATSIDAGNVKDIGNYEVSTSQFTDNNIPLWLYSTYLLFSGLWLVAIIYGWIRGIE